jgi:hypothetical protein
MVAQKLACPVVRAQAPPVPHPVTVPWQKSSVAVQLLVWWATHRDLSFLPFFGLLPSQMPEQHLPSLPPQAWPTLRQPNSFTDGFLRFFFLAAATPGSRINVMAAAEAARLAQMLRRVDDSVSERDMLSKSVGSNAQAFLSSLSCRKRTSVCHCEGSSLGRPPSQPTQWVTPIPMRSGRRGRCR